MLHPFSLKNSHYVYDDRSQEALISKFNNMQFDSIADLRANKKRPCANELIYVLGYWTPGDSGGGEFYWNTTSTSPDDGGIPYKTHNMAVPIRAGGSA